MPFLKKLFVIETDPELHDLQNEQLYRLDNGQCKIQG